MTPRFRFSIVSCALGTILLVPPLVAAPLGVGTVEVGVYGALGVPVAQEDVHTGPLYGAKVRLVVLPVLKAELSGTLFDFADGEVDVNGGTVDIPAPDIRSFNLNGILSFATTGGIGTYFTAGIGLTERTDSVTNETNSESVWNAGVGVTFGLPMVPVKGEVSPRLYITDNNGGTRKDLGIHVGVNYTVF